MQNNINGEEDVSAYYPDGDSQNMEKDDMQDEFFTKNQKKKNRIKKKNSRLSKGQIALIATIFVVYTVIIFAAAWMIFYRPSQPNNDIPFETEGNYVDDYDPDNPPLSGPETDENGDVIGGDYSVIKGVYNILVVGFDDEASLADVTMIVNCDINTKEITVMQIPRDTLVTSNVVTNKINAAFSTFVQTARNAGKDDPYVAAMEEYEQMLEKSLCINIHHTVFMGLEGFRGIVDAMDGVDIYVPAAMTYNDPEQGLYIDIPAGYNHLDGEKAEGFVRFRSGYVQADLGRVNAQKIFLTAMFNKVKSTVKSLDVSAITSIANEIMNCVKTNMSVSDMIYYAKFLLDVELSEINMTTIPGNMADPYYVINRQATLDIINEYFNIYEKKISDSIFDKDYLYCFTNKQYICDVYFDNAENVLDEVHNADEINDDSIYIPRT